jgi:hypothetical protein
MFVISFELKLRKMGLNVKGNCKYHLGHYLKFNCRLYLKVTITLLFVCGGKIGLMTNKPHSSCS